MRACLALASAADAFAARQVDVFDAAGEQRAALSSEFQTAISPRNIMHPRLPLLAAATASGRVHLYS